MKSVANESTVGLQAYLSKISGYDLISCDRVRQLFSSFVRFASRRGLVKQRHVQTHFLERQIQERVAARGLVKQRQIQERMAACF